MRLAINLLLFQIGWFSCVLLRSWAAMLIVAVILIVHICLSENRRSELLFIAILTLLGTLLDSTLMVFGVFEFEPPKMWPIGLWRELGILCPLWLTGLWAAFATTIGSTLKLLRQQLWLAACFGAIAAPLTYFAGMRLGAMQFGWSTVTSLLLLACIWALLLPMSLRLYRVLVVD